MGADRQEGGRLRRITIWGKALRVRYFSASLIPLLLGTVIADKRAVISIPRWLLVLGVVLLTHSASNLLNDLYDDHYGTDRVNRDYSPFNGGSRVLQEKLITGASLKKALLLCYTGGTICLLLLSLWGGGWGVFLLGLAGLGLGYLYSAPPFRLSGTALGELLVGLAFGPLLVMGTATALTGVLWFEPLLISLPVGALISAVIFINEFPDYQADRATGKKTLVVRMGKERSIRYFAYLLVVAHLLMAVNFLILGTHRYLLSFVFTLPLAVWVYLHGKQNLDEAKKLIPACAGMIVLHLLNGLTLVMACLSR